jgi:hypothetical protein
MMEEKVVWDFCKDRLRELPEQELKNYVESKSKSTRVVRVDLAYVAQAILLERGIQVAPPPLYRGSVTSRLAALEVNGVLDIHNRILAFVRSRGEDGATRCEIGRELEMFAGTTCARVYELIALNLLKETGRTRRSERGRAAAVLTVV